MATQGRGITPLRSLTLDLPPSCIEFCLGHPDYFVVGTYNLQKEDGLDAGVAVSNDEEQQTTKSVQTRNGSLVLFKLVNPGDINPIQTIPYSSAILDLHFHPHREKHNVMAVVSSTGTLSFFELSTPEGSPATLKEIITHKPLDNDEGTLFLSCSWHPHIPELLAITTSSYQVHILRVTDTWAVCKTRAEPVITHTLEAWTVAFSSLTPSKPNLGVIDSPERNLEQFTVFSGGDDSRLFATACVYRPDRVDDGVDSIETPYSPVTFRGHEAGVTAILPLNLQLASGGSVIITGSYDDCIRVFAFDEQITASLQRPRLLADQNLQGGVWRLKLIKLEQTPALLSGPEQQTVEVAGGNQWTALILASCMHAGSRVLEITGGTANEKCGIKILGRFEEHKSMNYGSDFQPGSEVGGRNLRCVSTSFYDRLLCTWEY